MNVLKRGFTLMELLVVVAIIATLAAVLFASFGDARATARDEARKANLKELQLAIELYRSQNGRYPEPGCSRPAWSWTGHQPAYGDCDEYIAGLVPDYISELPRDENVDNVNEGYVYRVDTGNSYKLMVLGSVESKEVASYADEFARCPRSYGTAGCPAGGPQATTYAVYSAGAEDW